MLLMVGLQVPVMPLTEVVGRTGMTEPEQYGPIAANTGVTFSLIVMVKVAVVAHWPASGVKV